MAGINKLTARGVAARLDPGRHSDGGGLYLQVSKSGSKSWLLVYRSPTARKELKSGRIVGREREMGLGSVVIVTLAQARGAADDARRLIRNGIDPVDERKRMRPESRVPTFGEQADRFVDDMERGWRNAKHRDQWRMTLREYAAPLRSMPVDEIDVSDVLACLKPHWTERPETADRLRGRIERVLNAAKASGHRAGENPAAWRGHLENLLPARQKLSRGHHAAMPYSAVPTFMAKLRHRNGLSPLALEFTILSAARSGEVRGARWGELDFASKVWTVPEVRMKAGKEHRVPLTPRMLAILAVVAPLQSLANAGPSGGLVFPGAKGAALSDMSLSAVLKRMKVAGATPHGFRSAFRDWAGSETSFSRELAEEALAHIVGNAVERAYRRGDALEKRRELMLAWEKFCCSGSVDNSESLAITTTGTN